MEWALLGVTVSGGEGSVGSLKLPGVYGYSGMWGRKETGTNAGGFW